MLGNENHVDLNVALRNPTEHKLANYKTLANGYGYRHNNIDDIDLFTDMGSVEPVPVFAEIPFGHKTGTMDKINNYRALINIQSGKILDSRPISNTYHLVNHDELFRKQADLLKNNSDLPTSNVTVLDQVYDNGRRASRSIHFNDLKMNVGNKNYDEVTCRLDVFNSVDMSWAFQVFSGAYRELCRNTQVFGGEKSYQQKHLHTSNLDTTALMNNAQTSLQAWNENKVQMMNWKDTPVSDEKFATFLANTLCKVEHGRGAKLIASSEHKVNQKLLNYLTHIFQKESQDCGRNLWSAYNALTHWSTHTDEKYTDIDGKDRTMGETKSKHTVRLIRQQKIRDLLSHDTWNNMEMVA